MNYQEKVKEFQLQGGEDLKGGLTDLRSALLQEEINELKQAIADNNRVEILDALCDIKYVNDGNANYLNAETESLEDVFWHNYIWTKDLNGLVESLCSLDVNDVELINVMVGIISSTLGFTLENFKTALDRVHESNMSKFCKDEIEANETVLSYHFKGIDAYYKQNDTHWVIYRESDNKILKSINYKPVKLDDLV